jgi:secreted PhoX family phosphatase
LGLVAVNSLPFISACGSGSAAANTIPVLGAASPSLSFIATSKSLIDSVVVPAGYSVSVVHATGDPIDNTVNPYSNTGAETDDWSKRIGDHHDGMALFYVNDSGGYSVTATNRAVLVVNHESSADSHFWHVNGQTSGGVSGKKFDQFGTWDVLARPGLEVLKEINHHGVSVVELTKDANGFFSRINVSGVLNRRITGQSVMNIQGPAAHLSAIRSLMVTRYSTDGATSRGTLNNCANGRTPWGTYLTCEENWAFYSNIPSNGKAPDTKTTTARSRYGVPASPISSNATTAVSQGWYTPTDMPDTDFRFSRWNISAFGVTPAEDFRNEPNTFGFVVEIDPLAAVSTPAKRVAMGRFAHENAACSVPVAGLPLAFYMGCDSRNEYIYKFVTASNWDPTDVGGGMAAGNKYLNEGKLYVARFDADGSGQWIELNISNSLISSYNINGFSFQNQAEVLVYSRIAADAVGATKMDRPEWAAVNPVNGEVYFTLTNNNSTNRTPTTTDPANPRSYNDPDGKRSSGNPNGHIIRFKESSPTATSFKWDVFLFGAEQNSVPSVNVSGLSPANDFSSPDGLWFSQSTPGLLWIQTDDGAYTDVTNCMLLAATPGAVGDGGKFVINNSLTTSSGTATAQQDTFVGGLLGETRLRRFLVGPKGAEITGLTESADGRALYVNIQHPGENTVANRTLNTGGWVTDPSKLESQWPSNGAGLPAPYGSGSRPRSATIIVTRNDGGKVGV